MHLIFGSLTSVTNVKKKSYREAELVWQISKWIVKKEPWTFGRHKISKNFGQHRAGYCRCVCTWWPFCFSVVECEKFTREPCPSFIQTGNRSKPLLLALSSVLLQRTSMKSSTSSHQVYFTVSTWMLWSERMIREMEALKISALQWLWKLRMSAIFHFPQLFMQVLKVFRDAWQWPKANKMSLLNWPEQP